MGSKFDLKFVYKAIRFSELRMLLFLTQETTSQLFENIVFGLALLVITFGIFVYPFFPMNMFESFLIYFCQQQKNPWHMYTSYLVDMNPKKNIYAFDYFVWFLFYFVVL